MNAINKPNPDKLRLTILQSVRAPSKSFARAIRHPQSSVEAESPRHRAPCLAWQVAVIAALLLVSSSSRADYTTTIQPGTQWGTWEGWGCSLCWWANVFGTRDDLADIVFTTNYTSLTGQSLPGLSMNIARYNAGASSWNSIGGVTMVASPNIPSFKQMHGYRLDWNST